MKDKLAIIIILLSLGCTSAYDYRVVRKKKSDGTTKSRENKPEENPGVSSKSEVAIASAGLYTYQNFEDWSKVKEGFLNTSTFQVKVTSLKQEKNTALEEAEEVSKRKALKLLIAEGVPYMSPESKVDIKILIEEYGKMIADSVQMDDKYHFVFQIKRPALEIIIKEKLK